MQFNTGQRELTLKIVYYGPGLSGKTTNLRALYQRIRPDLRGHLMTLDTADRGTARAGPARPGENVCVTAGGVASGKRIHWLRSESMSKRPRP